MQINPMCEEFRGGYDVVIYQKTSVQVLANNGVADVTFDVTRPGYTALGIVGFRLGAGGTCSTVSVQLALNTVTYRIINSGSANITIGDVNINVLYAKNV